MCAAEQAPTVASRARSLPAVTLGAGRYLHSSVSGAFSFFGEWRGGKGKKVVNSKENLILAKKN